MQKSGALWRRLSSFLRLVWLFSLSYVVMSTRAKEFSALVDASLEVIKSYPADRKALDDLITEYRA